ncbi:lipopolysaccharide biosynthesis protein [Streptomyces sp. NPDC047928]|uniref:lipopolysaccharide biosynthesis protein n=1 Tax=unclassified Streptomyces TaxID=2593676 RepID=UPI0037245326
MTLRPFSVRRRLGRFTRRVSRMKRPGRWAVVPAAVLLGATAGGTYGLLKTPEYAATSYVVLAPGERSDPAAAMGLAQAYGRVATDIAVTGDAAVSAGVSPAVLRASVRTATSPDAPMISITALSPRPLTAVALADSVARALVEKGSHTQTSTGVRVLQFSRATRPVAPVSPSTPLSALVGASAGGLLGGLALLVRPARRRSDERYVSVPGPTAGAAPQPEAV